MSTYIAPTIHPETGKIEMAVWIDNLPHPHWYTVEFPDGKRFDPRECEQVGPKAMAEIERLRAGYAEAVGALRELLGAAVSVGNLPPDYGPTRRANRIIASAEKTK